VKENKKEQNQQDFQCCFSVLLSSRVCPKPVLANQMIVFKEKEIQNGSLFIYLFIYSFMRMQVSGGWRQRGDWQIVACLRARRKFKLIILKEWTEIKQFVDD
jgi:hypothetical protein